MHAALPMNAPAPTPALQLTNFVLFQCAWFAAVLAAAQGHPWLACGAPLAAMVWHGWIATARRAEIILMLLACLMGVLFETLNAGLAFVTAAGAPNPPWPAVWLVLMWGLLAVALNVTLRWLKTRLWLAAILGAVAGPVSYAAGARLGALQFHEPVAATVTLALGWAVLMPLLIVLSRRFDGVAP